MGGAGVGSVSMAFGSSSWAGRGGARISVDGEGGLAEISMSWSGSSGGETGGGCWEVGLWCCGWTTLGILKWTFCERLEVRDGGVGGGMRGPWACTWVSGVGARPASGAGAGVGIAEGGSAGVVAEGSAGRDEEGSAGDMWLASISLVISLFFRDSSSCSRISIWVAWSSSRSPASSAFSCLMIFRSESTLRSLSIAVSRSPLASSYPYALSAVSSCSCCWVMISCRWIICVSASPADEGTEEREDALDASLLLPVAGALSQVVLSGRLAGVAKWS